MKFYRVFFPSPSIYANISQMTYADYLKVLAEWRLEARRQLDETGADHVIYGSRSYNDDGTLKEMHMYMLPLSDIEFTKRTSKVNDLILAVHRQK